MTNIILCGCNGKMGAAVQNFVNQRADCSIAAGVDVSGGGNGSFPVYTSLADVEEEAQVVVDGKFVTAQAAGAAFPFGLKLVEVLKGAEAVQKVQNGILYRS